MRKKLITLSGIDGSGKSFFARKIQDRCANNCKLIHFISFRLSSKLSFIIKANSSCGNKDYSKSKLSPLLLIIDGIRLRILLFLTKQKVVVCDRYWFDVILKNRYDWPFLSSILNLLYPSPLVKIIVTADPTLAQKKELGDHHSLSFLTDLQKKYVLYGKSNDFIILKNNYGLNCFEDVMTKLSI